MKNQKLMNEQLYKKAVRLGYPENGSQDPEKTFDYLLNKVDFKKQKYKLVNPSLISHNRDSIFTIKFELPLAGRQIEEFGDFYFNEKSKRYESEHIDLDGAFYLVVWKP